MAQTAEGAEKAAAKHCGLSLEEFRARRTAGLKRCIKCKEWKALETYGADATRGDRLTAMCRACRLRPRKTTGPGRLEREAKRREGKNWCRGCQAWLPIAEVRSGVCRAHTRAENRARYAANSLPYRMRTWARRNVRDLRPDPRDHEASLTEAFGGRCAYCPNPATTWDHINPVCRGGQTRNGNLVPACLPCNSQKRSKNVYDFAFGRDIHEALIWVLETGEALYVLED